MKFALVWLRSRFGESLGRTRIFLALLAALGAWLTPAAAHAAGAICGTPTSYNTTACFVDQRFDTGAVCNDGTVPTYWYRPGFGSGADVWIIWLEGGGTCSSQASCAVRVSKPGMAATITSNGWKATVGQGPMSYKSGINPMLYNANAVLLHYCSSDTWAGNKTGNGKFDINNSDTWSFLGRRVALVQFRTLLEQYPGIANASVIILGGDSSGGVGITEDANDILPLLPAAPMKLLVNDGGFTLDIGQFDPTQPSPYIFPDHPNNYELNLQERLNYWNARGDIECEATATTATQHANCYDTNYILQNGFIPLQQFVAISQIDTSQVSQQLCPAQFGYCNVPHNPTSQAGIYATAFGAAMASNVIGAGTQAIYSSFAPDQYGHVLLNENTPFVTKMQFPNGMFAPRDAFDHWLSDPIARGTLIGTGPGVQ